MVCKNFVNFVKLKGIDNLYMLQVALFIQKELNQKFSENHELNLVPKSKYGASKLANELHAKHIYG